MSDLEHSAKDTGLEFQQHIPGSDRDTTHEALRSAKEAEQQASDVGTLGVRQGGDLTDVDPLAIGLNDTASSLGEVITEEMDDNHTEGVQEAPPNTSTP